METQKNTDHIVFEMLTNRRIFEENYDVILLKYLKKNPDYKEKDFILSLIDNLSTIIIKKKRYNEAISIKNNEDIRKEIIEEGLPDYKNVEDWLLAEIEKRRELKLTGKEESHLSLLQIKLERLPKTKERNPLLYKGKKFNIVERYSITQKLLDIDSKIRKLTKYQKDKSILLANIMDCNEQTARELLNGTQQKRTSFNESLVNEYLKTLT